MVEFVPFGEDQSSIELKKVAEGTISGDGSPDFETLGVNANLAWDAYYFHAMKLEIIDSGTEDYIHMRIETQTSSNGSSYRIDNNQPSVGDVYYLPTPWGFDRHDAYLWFASHRDNTAPTANISTYVFDTKEGYLEENM